MSEVVGAIGTGIAVGKTAADVWQLSEKLELRKRLKDFFKKKPHIVVLGSTGTGKTNLLRSLANSAGLVLPIHSSTRTEASRTQSVRINDSPFVVVDTPGQVFHQPDRLATVREAMARGKVRIINVVSDGYHEYLDHANEAVRNKQPVKEFLQRHRQQEIESMKEWVPIVGDRNTASWVMTVITKADLWWPEQGRVVAEYTTGEYGRVMREVDAGLPHAVAPFCSVIHRFYGTARLPGVFDDSDRAVINTHFLEQLVELG